MAPKLTTFQKGVTLKYSFETESRQFRDIMASIEFYVHISYSLILPSLNILEQRGHVRFFQIPESFSYLFVLIVSLLIIKCSLTHFLLLIIIFENKKKKEKNPRVLMLEKQANNHENAKMRSICL